MQWRSGVFTLIIIIITQTQPSFGDDKPRFCIRNLIKLIKDYRLLGQPVDHARVFKRYVRQSAKAGTNFKIAYKDKNHGKWVEEEVSPTLAASWIEPKAALPRLGHPPQEYSWSELYIPEELDWEKIRKEERVQNIESRIRESLAYPDHWAVGPGANSRREEALKNFMRLANQIPAIKELQVLDREKYDRLINDLVTHVENYFTTGSPEGFTMMRRQHSPMDLAVFEKDAKSTVEKLYAALGDERLNPKIIFNEAHIPDPAYELPARPERPSPKKDPEVLRRELMTRVLGLDDTNGSRSPSDLVAIYRDELFSERTAQEIKELQRTLPHGSYEQKVRKTLVDHIQRRLLLNSNGESSQKPDLDLILLLEQFAIDSGDGNFEPSRIFPQLANRRNGNGNSRTPYELLCNIRDEINDTITSSDNPEEAKAKLTQLFRGDAFYTLMLKLRERDTDLEYSLFISQYIRKIANQYGVELQ